MIKSNIIIFNLLLSLISFSQVPNKISFQTVVRNSLGKLVISKNIGVRLSVLKTTATGTSVYVEQHTKTSNTNGLLTLEVGSGSVVTGTFSTIDWSQGPYFLKTEMDVNGGTNYTISGVTEFVSVPYAMNSKTSDAVKTVANGANVGDMNYWNGTTWVPLYKGIQGQTLTFCDGKPTWAFGGVCPGTISSLNCSSVTNSGTLLANSVSGGVTSFISYTGGNGGVHNGQVVTSTGVTGLTATLTSGTFANGNDTLSYAITGKPNTSGIANFAINIGGKACVMALTVNKAPNGPNISDIDGNIYKTVYIGTQQWMGENLKTAKYNDGTLIPNVSDNSQWSNLTTGAWAYYNNVASNNSKYGKLYNWYAVSPITNGNKNICPAGWHVPTDTEWTVLISYLGGEAIAGGKMREVGTINWSWNTPETSNSSLFTGLPGGELSSKGFYVGIGNSGLWWSSSQASTYDAYYLYLDSYSLSKNSNYKYYGRSVRCLKD